MANDYFFMKMVYAIDYYGGSFRDIDDSDHPGCPECGTTMDCFFGDRDYGDGYWECPNCGFKFTEADLDRYKEAASDFDDYRLNEDFDIDAYEDGEYDEEEEESDDEDSYEIFEDNDDDSDDDGETLSVDEAALIWASHGKDEDYMFGYSEEELEEAL